MLLENDQLKQIPYTTPEGYFDSLPTRISLQCSGQPLATKAPGIFSNWISRTAYVGMISAGLIAGIFFFGVNKSGTTTDNPPTFAEHYLRDMDEYALMRIINEPNAETTSNNTQLTNAAATYLAAENINLSDLVEYQ